MENIEWIKQEIVRRLKPLDPEKIILFGSYAYGKPHKDSDIDIYVVTKDNFIPKNWKEKMEIKLKYARKLRDLKQIYDIDLIVHTKKMHEKFLEINRPFAEEILKGEILYFNFIK